MSDVFYTERVLVALCYAIRQVVAMVPLLCRLSAACIEDGEETDPCAAKPGRPLPHSKDAICLQSAAGP